MYFAQNYFERYAHFQEISALKFFYDLSKKAVRRYKNGKKLNKQQTPVVFGTSIQDFNSTKDNVIARIEMNQRGVLRDFIGIDWDFDTGEEDKLQTVLESLRTFSQKHETPVLIYPTASYPKKPRIRTVMFTKEMMNGSEYDKAVTFVEQVLGVHHNDETNYDIKHNFNLPVINNDAQLQRLELIMKHTHKPLDNELWSETKPSSKKTQRDGNTHIKETLVTPEEKESHTNAQVKEGLDWLNKERRRAKQGSQFDFKRYFSFFQFQHAIARAEVIGSITRQQALMIMQYVADGNSDWERRNVEDYQHELPRVQEDESKLKRAKPLSFYFGIYW